MFTGLVETTGKVTVLRLSGHVNQLSVERPAMFESVSLGDSIAINGVCLTVSRLAGTQLVFDVMPETLRKTNLHQLTQGSMVNLERALALGDRFGGHLVTGHIDGVGRVKSRRTEANAVLLTISASGDIVHYLVNKGSIAVDGISLTIGGVTNDEFWVSIIPHTLTATALQYRHAGDMVNLEADIIGKYVFQFMERRDSANKGISADFLQQYGFK